MKTSLRIAVSIAILMAAGQIFAKTRDAAAKSARRANADAAKEKGANAKEALSGEANNKTDACQTRQERSIEEVKPLRHRYSFNADASDSVGIIYGIVSVLHSETITVDLDDTIGPKNTIKRGFVLSFEDNKKILHETMKNMADDGFTFVMGHRKLNLKKDEGTETTCGYPKPEIYRDSAGVYRYRVDTNYLGLIACAQENGLDCMLQISGTPPDFPRDPLYRRATEAERIANSKMNGGKGSAKGEPGKEFELPDPSLCDTFATVVSDWMKTLTKELPAALKPVRDFGVVWIGTEEVAHTIGHRIDIPKEEDDKKEHIERYIRHWAKLAREAKKKGIDTGGFQLNASNAKYFLFMAEKMLEENDPPPLRFITIQNYKANENNYQLLTKMRKAIEYLQSKRPDLYSDLKLVFNRYGWDKRGESGENGRFNSAMSIRMMLDSEKLIFAHADICYGYAFMAEGGDRMTTWVYPWINQLGEHQHQLSELPENVEGFAFSSDKSISIALWNNGKNAHDISLKLKSPPIAYSTITAMKGTGQTLEGKEMKESLGITWDKKSGVISGIILAVDSFVLLTLK